MNFFMLLKSILISIVEGVTEFLPISSTGHMILVGSVINFKGSFANLFEIFIQFGAILAVIVLYRHKITASLKALRPGNSVFSCGWAY
jgi:undecaprenyl-diphosphatase